MYSRDVDIVDEGLRTGEFLVQTTELVYSKTGVAAVHGNRQGLKDYML